MASSKPLRLAKDLVLPADAVTQTFAIFGKRGSGKTNGATVLVEELLKAHLHTRAARQGIYCVTAFMPTAYYIATVWLAIVDDSWDAGVRQVIRIPACGPEDYQVRVRDLWPGKVITFGPISRSRIQA